ncbi:nicotinate phosphoribosyltransferase [Amnibacterium sp. CER49]|uniref:nicotinate phosphoribosyltransferase n=1 Tax=Amnibacterium sp. CER49 TaxID=3039161 RepID=UPI00244A29FB|nr:nicotinate phosphoribosyltransferase [Amnibacterium sp. CER49]MDH2445294.1 nicotinate phosphoribosyltransferase [Amnibacterium sp. CER49]
MTSTALLTDRYELTMLDAALADGTALRRSVFEVFGRRLPGGRRYGVLAGVGRVLEEIERFRFGDDELAWLDEAGVVSRGTLDWLAAYRFSGTISGYREGELYFPGSPLLTVEGTFAEAVLLETLLLSVLNADSAVATAAARMVSAAAGRPLVEMGSRRTNEDAAVAAARAAWITGFAATSNLEAGRRWGVPTTGTAAHAFTLLHDDERAAFASQIAAMGTGTTLLVDTYDIEQGVRHAIEAGGTGLGAVRIDSGDLTVVVREVRRLLDSLGATGTRIVVTNDLDEYAIATLGAMPVDSYGVGTALVTGSGHPAAGLVYKLVAREDEDGTLVSVAKRSAEKAGTGGRKWAFRMLGEGGRASEERVVVAAEQPDVPDGRPLVARLVTDGVPDPEALGPSGALAARRHHAVAVAELPPEATRLSRGDPALPTVVVAGP